MNIEVVAVVGLGNIAKRHRSNLRILFPFVKIIALSSSGRFPKEIINDADKVVLTLDELIQYKPSFVIVASPCTSHRYHSEKLIENNIPVLIEKPVAADSNDAEKIRLLSEKYSTPVAVGYCLRYLPSAIKMKKILSEELIGKIYNCFINIGQYLPQWRPAANYLDSVSANKALGGGALLELSHELDYAQWLLGPLTFETAILRHSKELNLDVEEIADLVLSNSNGTVFNVHLDFLQKSPQRTCSVIGSKGRLDWDLLSNTIVLTSIKGRRVIYSEPEWDKNNMYLNMILDFVELIKGNENSSISISEAELSIELIQEIKVKAVWGKVQ
jgi:predicted dehydrogenase